MPSCIYNTEYCSVLLSIMVVYCRHTPQWLRPFTLPQSNRRTVIFNFRSTVAIQQQHLRSSERCRRQPLPLPNRLLLTLIWALHMILHMTLHMTLHMVLHLVLHPFHLLKNEFKRKRLQMFAGFARLPNKPEIKFSFPSNVSGLSVCVSNLESL